AATTKHPYGLEKEYGRRRSPWPYYGSRLQAMHSVGGWRRRTRQWHACASSIPRSAFPISRIGSRFADGKTSPSSRRPSEKPVCRSDRGSRVRASANVLEAAQEVHAAALERCIIPIVEREIALATERVERRLTAILAADVAGYSRLAGLDEEGTHAQLQDHLRSLVDPKIAEHRGNIVKNTGDGLLAEFRSVVDAVRCAVDVQQGMAERNANVPEEKRIEFRIGINVGDVMLDHGDIFGDGVNVAARLEGVAEPGAICISDAA